MAPRFLLAGLALHLVSCGIDMDGIAGAFQRPSAIVELDKTVDPGKATVLRLDTSNGRIKVRSGGEEIELHVKVSLSAGTQEAADAAAPQVAITESVEGDRLEFNVDLPEGTKLGGASYDVTCPLGMSLDLDTTNGRVEVEGPFPSVTVDTSNGSINLTGAVPEFALDTSNGRVEVMLVGDWGGTGRIDTSNGSITVECTGKLACTVVTDTSNGKTKVSASDGPGKLTLDTSNGSITCREVGGGP